MCEPSVLVMITRGLITILGILTVCPDVHAAIRYVRAGASGTNNGTSWVNAYRELASATDAAQAGDEIWIATGIYYPDVNLATGTHNGDRLLRFTLKANVSLYGGFAGTETTRASRNWAANRTILSGDIGQSGLFSDNTRSIMVALGGNVIEGLVFANGNANDPNEGGNGDVGGSGGAIWVYYGAVEIRHCAFLNNYAVYGGGIFNDGGGISVVNCLFANNSAQWVGGAIDNQAYGGPLTVRNCTMVQNSLVATSSRGSAIGTNILGTVSYYNNVIHSNIRSPQVETVAGTAVAENNILQEALSTPGANNLVTANAGLVRFPSSGADGIWGTMDDILDVTLRADSPALGFAASSRLPTDSTDADGDGNTSEVIPFDLSHGPRILDSTPDAGAFEFLNVAPTDISLTNASILEHNLIGTAIGTFSTTDANLGSFTYSLVPGIGSDDNGRFSMTGNSLLANEVFDYSVRNQLIIRVRSTDQFGLSVEKTFTIQVIDVVDQFVSLAIDLPAACEAKGGAVALNTGVASHAGAFRIVRQGQVQQPLTLTYSIGGTATTGVDYLPSLGTASSRTVSFAANETAKTVLITPLLDNVTEAAETVLINLPAGGTLYTLVSPSSGTITIHDSPFARWTALRNAATAAGARSGSSLPVLVQYGLGADASDPSAPLVWGHELGFTQDGSPCLSLVTTLGRILRDVRLEYETSTDLVAWQAEAPIKEVLGATELLEHVNLQFPLQSRDRLFLRVRATNTDRPPNFTVTSAGIPMIGIAPGAFDMGSTADPSELPVTQVQITQPFWISQTEVTQGQIGRSPFNLVSASPAVPEHPVYGFTWDQAAAFCLALSAEEANAGRLPAGYAYRLPTEAEWEYCCRAGTTTTTHVPAGQSLTTYAWYSSNSFFVVHGAGLKAANAWGLKDCYGNISEWCSNDWTDTHPGGLVFNPGTTGVGTFRVVRGGNFFQSSADQRSAYRAAAEPSSISPVIGFRVVLAPEN